MTKEYRDEIPPSTGRVYSIEKTAGNLSRIVDATQYTQAGVEFKAEDVCASCVLECNYAYSNGTHVLTHPNDGVQNLKFHATHGYQSGDTITLNGQTMSALTADGLPLDNGYFAADTLVRCFVESSNLFFTDRSRGVVDDKDTTNRYRFGLENGLPYVDEV